MRFYTSGEDSLMSDWEVRTDTEKQQVDVLFATPPYHEAAECSFDAKTLDDLIEALTCAREELD